MRILRIKDVTEKTALCRSKIYQMMDTGDFPKSIKLGARSVGWLDSEVENWIESKVMERDQCCATE